MKIGIALGGGGARGFAHLGVLKALEEKGVKPDMVSGASAGSIVGALLASGKSPDEIMTLVKGNRFMDYAKVNLPVSGLFTLGNFEERIKEYLPETFGELKLPFYIAISNLYSGKIEYINEGPLIPVIEASCSIPVLFSPVKIGGNLYVDGGLLDNLPYRPLVGQCDKIIAVTITGIEKREKIHNLLDVAVRTFELSVGEDRDEIGEECDLVIMPKGLGDFSILDTGHAEELYQIGYEACREIDVAGALSGRNAV